MVRHYDPDRPLPAEVINTALSNAIRAPSAGFSQGWDFVVLTRPEQREAYWSATTDPDDEPDSWLAGIQTAPTLILCLSDEGTYLRRYAESDKGWTAVDEGLGACFFGTPPEVHQDVFEAFDIPHDRNLVGVVSLGYPMPHPKS